MKKTISFKNIDRSEQGVISCEVTRETTEEFKVTLPYSFTPKVDLIAYMFAALSGKEFEVIEIDLPLGSKCIESISHHCGAQVVSTTGIDVRRRFGRESALNFSGGFDSLAAYSLLPDANLISLDFGGRFSRERLYFEKYNPLIFETNLTSIGLNRHSWQFMGIGSILLRDELGLGSYSFGSIMAGSLPRLLHGPLDQSTGGIGVANDLGMRLQNPVAGISEVAALSLVMSSAPHELIDVLHSVALPREDKFLRKHQMLRAVAARKNFPVSLPELPSGKARLHWGQNFATDLSSLFVAKQLGVEVVATSYIDGIPENVVEVISEISLDFLMRFNPHAYEGVTSRRVSQWYAHFTKNGVYPFDRKDWEEVSQVIKLLNTI